MEMLSLILRMMMIVSSFMALIALVLLQSRAKGGARACLILGALVVFLSPLLAGGLIQEKQAVLRVLIGAGGTNLGILLLSTGIILFSLTLPSKRLKLQPEDRRSISDQIMMDSEIHTDENS